MFFSGLETRLKLYIVAELNQVYDRFIAYNGRLHSLVCRIEALEKEVTILKEIHNGR